MSSLKEFEEYIKKIILSCKYDIDSVSLEPSSRKDLGEFQINVCMNLAKKYGKNPREIAEEIISKFDNRFSNVNIAGPGFINININEGVLIDSMNKSINNFDIFLDKEEPKKIIIDYGGANVAKALHVGHMRSANIGEALKRLSKCFGNEMIGDTHLGDLGRQSGMVISEIKKRYPNLPYFDKKHSGEYPQYKVNMKELSEYYPEASKAAKEDEQRMEEVRNISLEIDKGKEPFFTLWKDIASCSINDIKNIYNYLNCTFELWEGEMSSFKYMNDTLNVLTTYMYESNGAKVIDVKKDSDTSEMPPLIVIKSDGATIYATRDLATIYGRIKNYNPDEMWYVIDNRQSLYMEQIFRASYKSKLVDNKMVFSHYGFGTINGKDGKPYKTRDGGVLSLNSLIKMVKDEILKRMSSFDNEEEKNNVADTLTVAAIKYADLLPYRTTDYIFDVEKFSSFEGKTGPYILYSLVRIKSILNKVSDNDNDYIINNIYGETEKDIYVKILELSKVLKKSYKERSLSYICDYLYELSSLFSKFYSETNIINEMKEQKKTSYLAMLKLIYNTESKLLDILAIKIPDKM